MNPSDVNRRTRSFVADHFRRVANNSVARSATKSVRPVYGWAPTRKNFWGVVLEPQLKLVGPPVPGTLL